MSAPYQKLSLDLASQAPTLRLRIMGTSMVPILQDGESVLIQTVLPVNLQIGDLISFRRNSEVITHRLVAILSHSFLTMGDNVNKIDSPVAPEMILGRVFAIEKNGIQTLFNVQSGLVYQVAFRTVAWLSWQGAASHNPRWVLRFTRTLSRMVRHLVRWFL